MSTTSPKFNKMLVVSKLSVLRNHFEYQQKERTTAEGKTITPSAKSVEYNQKMIDIIDGIGNEILG